MSRYCDCYVVSRIVNLVLLVVVVVFVMVGFVCVVEQWLETFLLDEVINSIGMKLKLILVGEFLMGSLDVDVELDEKS